MDKNLEADEGVDEVEEGRVETGFRDEDINRGIEMLMWEAAEAEAESDAAGENHSSPVEILESGSRLDAPSKP